LTSGGGIFGATLGSNKLFHKALDAPVVKKIATPTLAGFEQLETRVLAAAKGIRLGARQLSALETMQSGKEADLAIMKVRIFADQSESPIMLGRAELQTDNAETSTEIKTWLDGKNLPARLDFAPVRAGGGVESSVESGADASLVGVYGTLADVGGKPVFVADIRSH
jgi:hypothetical protein